MDLTNNALFATVAGGIILAILSAVCKRFEKKQNLDNNPQSIERINDKEEASKKVEEINLSETEKSLYKELATLFLFAEGMAAYFSQIYNQASYKNKFDKFRYDVFIKCQDLRSRCKSSPDVSQYFSENFLTVLSVIFNTDKLDSNGSESLNKGYEISLYDLDIKQAFSEFENKFRKK